MAEEAVREYQSSLADLTLNSKPLINMLTMLAEDSMAHASEIVGVIENHIKKTAPNRRLPALYLVDSILKNVQKGSYHQLISRVIVSLFVEVFEKVDEKTRQALFKLRQTWNELFSASKLYAIDVRVHQIDPAWPITAPPPDSRSIHINPKFIVKEDSSEKSVDQNVAVSKAREEKELARQRELLLEQKFKKQQEEKKRLVEAEEQRKRLQAAEQAKKHAEMQREKEEKERMAQELQFKQQELMRLEKQALEFELAEAKAKLEQQKREMERRKELEMKALSAQVSEPVSSTSSKAVSSTVRDPRLRKVAKDSETSMAARSNSPTSHIDQIPSAGKTLSNKVKPAATSPKHSAKNTTKESQSRSERHSSSSSRPKEKHGTLPRKVPAQDSRGHRSREEREKAEGKSRKSRSYRNSKTDDGSDEESRQSSQRHRSRSPRNNSKKKSPTPTKAPSELPSSKSKQPEASQGTKDSGNTEGEKKRSQPNNDTDNPNTNKNAPPPAKRSKRDTTLPDDLAELFGKEDTDYRSLPPIPKLSVTVKNARNEPKFGLTPKSPHSAQWSQFKADRPEEFPQRRLSIDEFRSPLLPFPVSDKDRGGSVRQRRGGSVLSPEQEKLDVPLMLEQAPEIMRHASEQVKKGQLSHDGYQELLKQLGEMCNLQKRKNALRGLPSDSSSFRRDGSLYAKDTSQDVIDSRRPQRPFKPMRGTHVQADKRPGPNHYPSRPLLPNPKSGPDVSDGSNMRYHAPCWEEGEDNAAEWYGNQKYYSPESDARWSTRVRDLKGVNKSRYGVVLNSLVFDVVPNDQRKIRMKGNVFYVMLDSVKKEVFMSIEGCQPACYYRLGDPPRSVTVGGVNLRIFVLGPMKRFWIDGHQFEIKADAPPLKVLIAGNEHAIRIDSFSNRIIADGYDLCPFEVEGPQHVKIAYVEHLIEFKPPPRKILIDNNLCDLYLGGSFPYVTIEGKPYGIRFKGPPRNIIINGVAHLTPFHKPLFVRINSNKPHLIAFGGPGHEVIIDDQWFEVKFDSYKEVQVGVEPVRVELVGNAPEVQILGEMDMEWTGDESEKPWAPQGSYADDPPLPMPPQPPQPPQTPVNKSDQAFKQEAAGGSVNMSVMSEAAPLPPPVPPAALLTKPPQTAPATVTATAGVAAPHTTPQVDVNDLFSKLLMAGIIQKKEQAAAEVSENTPTSTASAEPKKEPASKTEVKSEKVNVKKEEVPPVKAEPPPDLTDFKTANFKKRYESAISGLYTGIQCTSCGQRFHAEDTDEYREHLDWHFRHNKREKDGVKIARFRHWYCNVVDWIQFEEMSSLEEKTQSAFFESMMSDEEQAVSMPVSTDTSSCPVAGIEGEDVCEMCHEAFEQFFDEEEEEWHLKDAIRVDGKTYHPVCYEDAKDSSSQLTSGVTDEQVPDPISDPVAYLQSLAKQGSLSRTPDAKDAPSLPELKSPVMKEETDSPTESASATSGQDSGGTGLDKTENKIPSQNAGNDKAESMLPPHNPDSSLSRSPLPKLSLPPVVVKPIVIIPEGTKPQTEEPGTPVLDEDHGGNTAGVTSLAQRSGTPVMDEPTGELPVDGFIVQINQSQSVLDASGEGHVNTDEEFIEPGTPVQDENMSS